MTSVKQSAFLFFGMLLFIFLIAGITGEAKDLVNGKHQKTEKVKTKHRQQIVFLITKDSLNYEADKTIPIFAKMLKEKYGYDVTVLLGSGERGSYHYPHIEKVSKADLLIVFARRIALPHEQMNIIKSYLATGKPLVGIRTANHAFAHSFSGADQKIAEGYEDWPEFVADILGCKNRGYGPAESGIDVSIIPTQKDHPIVKDVDSQWHSEGSLYLVAPLLDTQVNVLLNGKVNDIVEPIAWTRTADKSKVFYTSLGYPTDFQSPQFVTLLVNAIKWTLLDNH